jgi:hypothetical protein
LDHPAPRGASDVAAFLPALRSDFVTWDDDRNFTGNIHYRGLGTRQLTWMWTTFHMGHYVPLSWMTLGLDYDLWGMNAAGYHLTNVLLHTANAVLVYFLARRILRLAAPSDTDIFELPAALAALLFSVHPLRVESVAWVAGVAMCCRCSSHLRASCAVSFTSNGWARRVATPALVCRRPGVGALLKATSMKAFRDPRYSTCIRCDGWAARQGGGANRRGAWRGAHSLLRRRQRRCPSSRCILAQLGIPRSSPCRRMASRSASGRQSRRRASPVYEMPRHIDPFAVRFVASYVVIALTCVAFAASARHGRA